MSEFDLLAAGTRGMLRAHRMLDLEARNLAAAQAATPGHEYARLVARFEGDDDVEPRIEVSAEPADAFTELVAMLDAQRSYEADASVFDLGKRLAERTLDIGRS